MTHSSTYTPPQTVDSEDLNSGSVIPGLWRDEITDLTSIGKQGSNNSTFKAQLIFEQYKSYFVNDGSLPWQWKSVGLKIPTNEMSSN